MSNADNFRLFLKKASYNVPEHDVYSRGSTRAKVDQRIAEAGSRKNIATLASGLAAGKLMHRVARPFSDKKIPLKNQKFRNLAALGAGIYAAKKTRNLLSKKEESRGV